MAKKIVTVDEDAIRGYMTGEIPSPVEKGVSAAEEVPSVKVNPPQDTDEEAVAEKPKARKKRENDVGFRQKFLVNTPMPGRIQVYVNRQLYDEIKNYLNVIAPEVSISSYISNIIAEHIELNIEEIAQMYKNRFSPPKIQ